jgi:hypothetical protein
MLCQDADERMRAILVEEDFQLRKAAVLWLSL